MNINSEYISIEDAASYFNVNKVTVRKWCDKGLLSMIVVGNKYMVSTESIQEVEKNRLSITKVQKNIEKYLKDAEEYKLILQGELNVMKEEITQRHWCNNHIQYISEMTAILLDALTGKNDEDSNVRLVRYFLEGEDYKDIALLTGIPVKQVMNTIRTFGRTLLRTRTYARMLEMSVNQDTLVRKLQDEKHELEKNIRVIQAKYDTLVSSVIEDGLGSHADKISIPDIGEMSLSNQNFSTRVNNILKSYNIKTVRDLIAYTENEVLKLSNMGTKSFQELTHFLHGFGLAWAEKEEKIPGG